jgi:methionyl-tRNA formyltransferase
VGRVKLLFCCYREWAQKIANAFSAYDCIFVGEEDRVNLKQIINYQKPDYIFFLGWSWYVPEEIVNNHTCIALHPSALPKYRGGSPIQNQIIHGEKEGAVSLFRMDTGVDTGPIYFQEPLDLSGELDDIFERMVILGIKGIYAILNGAIPVEQDESQATTYKRRGPSESEIYAGDFFTHTAKEIYDKVRCLQDPYPNPFIICKDGTKLYLHKVSYEEKR